MKPIVLAGCTDAFARRVAAAADDVVQPLLKLWTEHLAAVGGLEGLAQTDPSVVLIGPGLADGVATQLAHQFASEHPETAVVVVVNAKPADPEATADLMGTLTAESDADTINATLRRALQVAERIEADPAFRKAITKKGTVTTILSPKGGAGKTVVSTNLAVGLATEAPRRVVLVDLDLQFGDVAYALGLKPSHTMFDVASASDSLDLTALKVHLTLHDSGLYALCAPDDPARGEIVPVDVVARAVELLASHFDHVVVDTSAGLTEHTLATLDASTDVVFLADMDVPSVRHLNKVIRAFDRLKMTHAKRHFVLNRADARVGISMLKLASQAGLDIDVEIPHSKHVPVSLNTGEPIITANPRNPFARAVSELVERLTGPVVREANPPLQRTA